MTDYETLRARHAQQAGELVGEHQQRIMWTADRLHAEREERLRALIRLAKERSPWHRQRLAHVDADTLTESDLLFIPPMTKDDLMENFDGIVTDRRLSRSVVEGHLDVIQDDAYLLDEFHSVASGGSSGTRGVFGASIAVRTQGPVDTLRVATALESELLRVGLPDPSVTVEIVDGFDRQKTGKLKRFLPLP